MSTLILFLSCGCRVQHKADRLAHVCIFKGEGVESKDLATSSSSTTCSQPGVGLSPLDIGFRRHHFGQLLINSGPNVILSNLTAFNLADKDEL